MTKFTKKTMAALSVSLLFSVLSTTVVKAQSKDPLWEAKLYPTFALNLKSGLKGPGYAIGISRDIKNGFRAELAISGAKFKSPGTFNPKGSKKFPAGSSHINFSTSTWELACYKVFKPENDFRPIVGLGYFKRSWKETILENGAKTSLDQTGSSGGIMISGGAEKTIGEKVNLQLHTTLHTNKNFYSIWSFRIGVGYRFGLI